MNAHLFPSTCTVLYQSMGAIGNQSARFSLFSETFHLEVQIFALENASSRVPVTDGQLVHGSTAHSSTGT